MENHTNSAAKLINTDHATAPESTPNDAATPPDSDVIEAISSLDNDLNNASSSVNESISSLSNELNSANSNISESITSLSNDTSKAIEQLSAVLTDTLSSPGVETILFALSVAFVGALSAYLFNLFHWRMVEKKRKISRISEELNALIKSLESVAVKYWVQDYKEDNKEEFNAIEVEIKAKLRLITQINRIIFPILEKSKETGIVSKLKNFQTEIFELVTGDDFESKTRKASKIKAMKISRRCSDMSAKIISLESIA